MREGAFGIAANGVDSLEAEFDRAGLCLFKRGFDGLRRIFGRFLHLGKGVLGLVNALFSKLTERLGKLGRVEGENEKTSSSSG